MKEFMHGALFGTLLVILYHVIETKVYVKDIHKELLELKANQIISK